MPLPPAPHGSSYRPLPVTGTSADAASIAACAAAFQVLHGAPGTWSAEDFKVYLDLERAPSEPDEGEAP